MPAALADDDRELAFVVEEPVGPVRQDDRIGRAAERSVRLHKEARVIGGEAAGGRTEAARRFHLGPVGPKIVRECEQLVGPRDRRLQPHAGQRRPGTGRSRRELRAQRLECRDRADDPDRGPLTGIDAASRGHVEDTIVPHHADASAVEPCNLHGRRVPVAPARILRPMGSTVEIFPDEARLAAAAADRFVTLAAAAVAQRGRADIALAGGSTPRAMNALLCAAPRKTAVDWGRLRFFFGDERTVPPDDPESNYAMNRETLFDPLGIPANRVFRMRGEGEPAVAAAEYARVLASELGAKPRFDVLFLGMGPDGHTASLFPGTLTTVDDKLLVVANRVEKFATWRITVTPHVINDARAVVITCGGAGKADALHAVFDGPRDLNTYPIQLVAPVAGELVWLIDEPAAAKLTTVR